VTGYLALVLLLWPGIASACSIRELATVPLEIAGSAIVMPVVVNGIAGNFILDTGAALTVVTPDAVSHFGLALDDWTSTTMRGIGGIEQRRNADPRSLEVGGVALRRRSLARDQTLRVATLSRSEAAGHRIDGLLGRDFLSAFDLALDLPRRSLTLYEVSGCVGRFLPWTGDYVSVTVENPAENALVVPVELDGVPLRALLDSGASSTLVAARGMARLGLGLDRLRDDPSQIASGMGPHTVTVWQHHFHALQIGSETFPDPTFLVTPIQLNPVSDMLLGFDWLMSRKVWISYASHQLFVSK
jgi:predicted aspartyl protease